MDRRAFLATAAAAGLLSACGGKEKPPGPAVVTVNAAGQPGMNPAPDGTDRPVTLTLLRLKDVGAFNAAGSLGFIAGPLVGGLVSQSVAAHAGWETGYRAAFAAAGVAEILCVLVTLPLLVRLKRLGKTR